MKKNKSPQKNKSALIKLFKYLKPYSFVLMLAIILVVLSTFCTIIGPKQLSNITDIIQQGVSVNVGLTQQEMDTLKTQHEITLPIESFNGAVKYTYLPNGDDVDFNEGDTLNILISINYAGQDKQLVYNVPFEDFLTSKDGYWQLMANEVPVGLGISYKDNNINLWLNTNTKINIDKIIKICVALVVLYISSYILNVWQNFIMARVHNKISKNMRTDVINKINKLPLKYFDKITYGEVLSRMVNDVDTIGTTLNDSVMELIGAVVLFVGSLVMMFVTEWHMATAGVLASMLGFALMAIIIKKSQKYFIRQQKTLGQVNGVVEEYYSGQMIIKAYNAEEETLRTFDKANNDLYTCTWKSQFFSGIMHPLMGFIGNLSYVVVCVVGAILVHFNVINFAAIIAIMIYIRQFTRPLSQLSQASTELQTTAAATERVFDLLESSELKDESKLKQKLDSVVGKVEFKNIKFGYTPSKIIIKDFSATIKPGQKVAIVGPTGAGKTTLVNLLMKFYDLNDGEILIDDVPISKLTRENIHDVFGMVLQDTWLFQGTVKENLRFNKQDITDEQIINACKACGVDHLIKTLPNGYDTVLDDNTNISAGQKQLLTIARAMVENAPLLILDEATSSVDTRTEILIQKAMDKLTANRTSFVIAHRLSTIKNADLILVMKDGDIVEKGNHAQLLKKGGVYAELYNSQFDN